MKRLAPLLFLALAFPLLSACQPSGPEAEASLAYQEQATAQVMGGHMAGSRVIQRFGGPLTKIEDVTYELESFNVLDEGRVELVIVQSVQFRWVQDGPSRPEYSRSRHTVLMERNGQEWAIAKDEKEKLD